LAEILMTLAFKGAGWPGLVILTGAAVSATVLIMGLRVGRDLSGLPLVIVTGLGAGLLTAGLLARPHIVALPVLAAWGAGLMAARDRGRAPSLALAALMTLWSNLHGGFAFGLALIGPFALDAIVEAKAEARGALARDWALFALASIAAALVNPFGVDALLFPFRLLNIANLAGVSEWAPADFSRVSPLEIALLLLLGVALTRPLRLSLIPALLLIGLVHLSLQHGRHEMLLGVLAPMLLARPLAKAMPGESSDSSRPQAARTMIVATLVGLAALSAMRLAATMTRVDGPAAPISAIAAVPAALRAKPVLNDYSFGGYLIWSDIRPFIDGRADMFGDAFLTRYGKIASGDADVIERALRDYDVAWTIFTPDKRAVEVMDREPGWRRLYSDATAVVHVRESAHLGEKDRAPGEELRGAE
jgi:hypothetical protein